MWTGGAWWRLSSLRPLAHGWRPLCSPVPCDHFLSCAGDPALPRASVHWAASGSPGGPFRHDCLYCLRVLHWRDRTQEAAGPGSHGTSSVCGLSPLPPSLSGACEPVWCMGTCVCPHVSTHRLQSSTCTMRVQARARGLPCVCVHTCVSVSVQSSPSPSTGFPAGQPPTHLPLRRPSPAWTLSSACAPPGSAGLTGGRQEAGHVSRAVCGPAGSCKGNGPQSGRWLREAWAGVAAELWTQVDRGEQGAEGRGAERPQRPESEPLFSAAAGHRLSRAAHL